MTLEQSHDELRAALILAGRELRRLPAGYRKQAVLAKLRQVLREARIARKLATRVVPFTTGAGVSSGEV